jgi:NADPH-dependent ferric siderophore reductase
MNMRVWVATVVRTGAVTPSMRRIVLGGLAGYRSTGVGDEYVRLVFPAAGSADPVLAAVTDGQLDYGSIDLATMRTYTVRAHDPAAGEVTIDFVIHAGGVAAAWAAAARPGDRVGINTPCALYAPPEDLAWQVLVADCAGLPAAARLLETTPPGIRTRVVIEVPDARHHVPLPARAGADVRFLHGGNGFAPSRLEEIVRSLPRPDGTGYVWVAGEAGALRGVRRYLRKELGLPATAFKAVGYWQERAEAWRDRYQALDDDTKASLDAVWTAGSEPVDLELRYDEELSRLGL